MCLLTFNCSHQEYHICNHSASIPTTYLCGSKNFLVLLKLRSRKITLIKDVDIVMRGAIETRLKPRFFDLGCAIQHQPPHYMIFKLRFMCSLRYINKYYIKRCTDFSESKVRHKDNLRKTGLF